MDITRALFYIVAFYTVVGGLIFHNLWVVLGAIAVGFIIWTKDEKIPETKLEESIY